MLSAQRKEFDEKKKDESPYPRDFTRWYELDYFRRPRRLKRRRFYFTLATAVVFALLSVASVWPPLRFFHQAAPVATAHAMFNGNCATCHDQTFSPVFRLVSTGAGVSVSDQTCTSCHDGAPHHAKQSHEPACASCHPEHQGHEVLKTHVADGSCAQCHGALSAHVQSGETTTFEQNITTFGRDHPEFKPSLKGKKDNANIKFSHKAHLDLPVDELGRARGGAGFDALHQFGAKLECVSCHHMDEQRRYPLPIQYDKHCAACHQLNVALVGKFTRELEKAAAQFAKTPLPHKEPAVVRAVLRDRLLAFAQKNRVAAGPAAPDIEARLPPWKTTASISADQWSWTVGQGSAAEAVLFANKQWSKAERLTWCSHCHIEKTAPSDRPGGLPEYYPTRIPSRWYGHSVFNHGSHRLMSCVACHDRNAAGTPVSRSKITADILLPTIQSCQECHRPSGGARADCAACHRYHDRGRERSADGFLKLTDVLRRRGEE